jgi:fatty acid desaturase
MSDIIPLSPDERRRLHQKSDVKAVWAIIVNYAIIAFAFALPIFAPHILSYIAAALLLSGRALGLTGLSHDACHNALFTSVKMNEFVGKWLLAALPNVPFETYRAGHLQHHKLAGTEKDPDLSFVVGYPTSKASMRRKLTRDIVGITGFKDISYQLKMFSPRKQMPTLVAHVALFAILALCGYPVLYLLWWAGQLFAYPLILRLRIMGEHGAVKDHLSRDPRENTRTTKANVIERLLISPNHLNFHLEHHLFAGMPSYNLARAHKLLSGRGYYDGFDCINTSYVDVVRKCIGERHDRKFDHLVGRSSGHYANMI